MAHRSELGGVFRTESPRNTPVQQGLIRLGLQQEDFQTNRGRLPIVQLRPEPFESCPHETGPSFDFEPEVSVFVCVDVSEVRHRETDVFHNTTRTQHDMR